MAISFDKIKRRYESIKNDVNRIETSNIYHLRKTIYDELIIHNSPAIFYSRIILNLCTKESIEKNYDDIMNFFHNSCGLSMEKSEALLNSFYKDSPYEQDKFNKHKRVIFSSKWISNNREDFREYRYESREKTGLYSVYFSEECTYEDINWYIEQKLRKILEKRTIESNRLNTKGLAEKCLIGWLTLYKFKPKEIDQIFLKLNSIDNPEKIPYQYTTYRIRNRLKEENWFIEARNEMAKIIHDNNLINILNEYDDKKFALYKSNKKITSEDKKNFYECNKKPRFLELSFCNDKKPTFHVKYVK